MSSMFTFVVWAIGLWIIYRVVMFLVMLVSDFCGGIVEGWRESRRGGPDRSHWPPEYRG